MDLVDLILNLAALLLWVTWRSLGFARKTPMFGVTLASTLRRAGPVPGGRWLYLAGLAVLLVGRSVIYWRLGTSLGWTATLELPAITLAFRSDYYLRMLAYSFLSFGLVLGIFYVWLLLLGSVNWGLREADPIHRAVREHLGKAAHWPRWLLVALPMVVGCVGWLGLAPGLVWLGLLPRGGSIPEIFMSGLVMGAGAYLPWKELVAVVLMLHLVNNYVYMGNHAFWNYIGLTGEKLMMPLRWLPLRFGRVDLAPIAGMALVLFAGEMASRGLTWAFQRLTV